MHKQERAVRSQTTANVYRRNPFAAPLEWLRGQVTAPRMQALYDQTIVSGVNFFLLVYLGRRLEAEQFGFFTLVYMSIFGLGALNTALVNQPFNLIGATRPTIMNLGHLHALVRVHVFIWLPIMVAFLSMVGWFFFPQVELLGAAAIYLCVFLLQELLRRYWYTCGDIHRALTNDLIAYGLQLPIVFLCAMQPSFDAATALFAMTLAPSLALVQAWFQLRGRPAAFTPLRAVIDAHRKTGAWLVLGAISAYGATQLYPYMVAGLGAGAVAAFAAARNLMNALNVPAQAANNYLPVASKRMLEANGAAALSAYITRVGLAMFMVAGLFAAAIAIEAPTLLHWIYGKSFDGAGHLIPLMTAVVFGTMLFPVINAGLMVLQQTPVIFVSNVIATVFNLTVGWWLIRRYGVDGAAIAASLSVLLVLIVQVWRLKVAFANAEGRRFFSATPARSW